MLFPILSIHISDTRSNKHHFIKGLNKQSNWNGLRYHMFQFANIFNYSKMSIYRTKVLFAYLHILKIILRKKSN
ncbi:uncharacterized protein OCT59_020921 [Rhizophagus irregularis]|uniref:uncharacterized protein n=1 Tax=Rhizophagus irregularis TaxID=588596 RepID=UPI0033269ED1|nr:hypothetical protein OCT59_020921 [Rhizophagus irregularis]